MSDYPWRDPDVLRELYWEKRMSSTDIADELGCEASTVRRWMEKNGIERREVHEAQQLGKMKRPVPFYTKDSGYEVWKDSHGVVEYIYVHRLLAVSEFGTEAVKQGVVHHKNSIPWDNRPQNIEVMDHSKHMKIHDQERERDDWGRYA